MDNKCIRNIDDRVFRDLKARAAFEGRTVGELANEAFRGYLGRRPPKRGPASLQALRPEPYPEGNERLSSEIDAIVYGAKR